jgi:hypothetical protein
VLPPKRHSPLWSPACATHTFVQAEAGDTFLPLVGATIVAVKRPHCSGGSWGPDGMGLEDTLVFELEGRRAQVVSANQEGCVVSPYTNPRDTVPSCYELEPDEVVRLERLPLEPFFVFRLVEWWFEGRSMTGLSLQDRQLIDRMCISITNDELDPMPCGAEFAELMSCFYSTHKHHKHVEKRTLTHEPANDGMRTAG